MRPSVGSSPFVLAVLLEHRFRRTPNGAVWAGASVPRSFFGRYLDVFDSVKIIARVEDVETAPDISHRVDGPNIDICGVPSYTGPRQYLLRRNAVRSAIMDGLSDVDAAVLRVPSQLATLAEPALRRKAKPYGLEVVADPSSAFSVGGIEHPLRAFFRWWMPRRLASQVRKAPAVAYVTKSSLQERYPAGPGAHVTSYTTLDLHSEDFVSSPREHHLPTGRARILTIGSMAQMYKGFDVLIRAAGICLDRNLELSLTIVGSGRYRPALEHQAAALGNRIRFTGELLPGSAIRKELDRADLFVLPSRSEGLPRALIEAMARALPCVATRVGGIPELLDAEDLVPPGNPHALAEKIIEVASDPERSGRMSKRNLATSRQYRCDLVQQRRSAFYSHLRSQVNE